ncbi:MAG: magnesium chelatase subunit H [Firmicutes bacterium]|nr:magnesium chelatase subunit H [Bacillota bacterium]
MKLTVISVSTVVLSDLVRFNSRFQRQNPGILELKLYNAARRPGKDKLDALKRDVEEADVVIADLMGSPAELTSCVLEALKHCRGHIIPIGNGGREFLRLGSLNAGDVGMRSSRNADMSGRNADTGRGVMNAASMQKMMDMAEKMGKAIPFGKPRDMRNLVQIGKYWKNAGEAEIESLIYLLLRDYGGIKTVPAPRAAKELEELCISSPSTGKIFKSFEQYRHVFGINPEKSVVALLYYGHSYPNRTWGCVADIAEKLKDFANVLPVAFTRLSGNNIRLLENILFNAAGRKADLVVNFMSFRLGAGPMGGDAQAGVALLDKLNVPVLHPFFMSRRSREEWFSSPQGSSASEFLISVMLPELDGCIETYPVGSMESGGTTREFDLELNELALIDERAEKLAFRVKNWLSLKEKKNSDKRVAIICYNYPPGEGNIFGGAFLDTFESVAAILNILKKEGYCTESLTAAQLMEYFSAGGIVNSPRWSEATSNKGLIRYGVEGYKSWLQGKTCRADMEAQWGKPSGEVMSDGTAFLIPGLVLGNVFIGLQPTRGVHEHPEKAYHDKTLLPHHQYMAFYRWVREEFKADVMVHVGTHGTLEFLKGKECGMSGECFPDMLVGDVPHVYLYYTGNPAEAMIAKRRSHAVLVGYQPPAFTEGGLYGEIAAISALIDEYHESLRASPARSPEVLAHIHEAAARNNLPADLDELEKELYRMKRTLIPKGLHRFGKGFNREEASAYAGFVLRYDRGEVKALRRILAQNRELDYDRLLECDEVQILKELDLEANIVFMRYAENGNLPDLKDNNLIKELKCTLDYGVKLMKECMVNHEIDGLLRVLEGGYLPARLAGDIVRNPEVLPAGFNLYQFDPRFVPTCTAYERGRRIAENTILQYKKDHGDYPQSTAVILWGLETSRTQGETFGQILSYLGVKAVQGKNAWEPEYEIIPAEELQRPRIDVVINICGFFRDMFPNLIGDLNNVLERLASLDEPEEINFFKKNCRMIYELLMKEGYEQEEALELSRARIFGPAEAEYGTGITKLIETRNWQDEKQISEVYIKSLKHVYSKNYRGRAVEGLLDSNLKAVDVVSQIRSSHEYEVTDLDHYYEFFGGLAKSVEMAKGKRCEIYISDSTGERMETESVEKSIARGVRTRLLNPKWIDGMLEHKYHGVQKIEERFENMVGLAATTNRVDNWIYSRLHEKYVSDAGMRKRLAENNRWAYLGIVERLMELSSRGYWKASDAELEELRQVYLELEGDIERDTGN